MYMVLFVLTLRCVICAMRAGGLQRQLHMSAVCCAAAASGDMTARIKDDMKVSQRDSKCDSRYIRLQGSPRTCQLHCIINLHHITLH
jgi:hypothetical protein